MKNIFHPVFAIGILAVFFSSSNEVIAQGLPAITAATGAQSTRYSLSL